MKPLDRSILTIGNFDGVHRAHQQLLAQAGLFSSTAGAPVTVMTFEPHPLTVIAPQRAPLRLSLMEQKLSRLEQAGAESVVIARPEPALLGMEASDFVRNVIRDMFRPTHVVEGPSFGFGHKRRGTPELLQEMGPDCGFEAHILEPLKLEIDGERLMVSSSVVRKLLLEGKVRRAAMCLGSPYCLRGKVVEGARRGRTIGFPTANLESLGQMVPGAGVYAGRCRVDGTLFAAAVSIGTNPTFDGESLRVEAHLLEFDGDLYGRVLDLEFIHFLRAQRKFSSAEELVDQLHKDVARVLEQLPVER